MKIFFRLLLVIVLGILAVGMDAGLLDYMLHSNGAEILVSHTNRFGYIATDRVMAMSIVAAPINMAFIMSVIVVFFPSAVDWLQRKKEAIWPQIKDPDPGPSWICAHCHEENPGNFDECWKCQRNRPRKSVNEQV
jgi:hypothetical protein